MGTLDPQRIVAHLMGIVEGYTLQTVCRKCGHIFRKVRNRRQFMNCPVCGTRPPEPVDHPQYFPNAWHLTDFLKYEAECQAIVRWVRGVICQVACPGTIETVVVWAEPTAPMQAKEAPWGRGGLNPSSQHQRKMVLHGEKQTT